MHPGDIVTAISRAALVRDHGHKLVVASVEALTMWPVQLIVMLLVCLLLLSGLGCLTHEFSFLLLLSRLGVLSGDHLISFGGLLHLAFEANTVFLLTDLGLEGSTMIEGLLELIAAELVHVQHLGVGNRSQNLRFSGLSAAYLVFCLPVEANEVDRKVARQLIYLLLGLIDAVAVQHLRVLFELA